MVGFLKGPHQILDADRRPLSLHAVARVLADVKRLASGERACQVVITAF
jgi:hypothetical protein